GAVKTTVAADVGSLYSANTGGAAAGAIAAGFWLIPAIGVRSTTLVGVALNLLAALGALWLASITTKATAETAERAESSNPERNKKTPRAPRLLFVPQPGLAWSASAVSGFVALIYEVAWTRLLA